MPPTAPKSLPRSCKIAMAALLALVALAYFPVGAFDFVNMDDHLHVTGNPHVTNGLTLQSVFWAVTSAHAGYWIPLTWISHMLDVQLFGLKAGGHHLVNALLHALNVLLLFVALRALMLSGRAAQDDDALPAWKCLAVAALFALHPLHVESVAWVAERKDVLSTLFFLLALRAYAWHAQSPGMGRMLAVGAAMVLGLAAKPMLVTLPVVLLLLDFWPLQRVRSGRFRKQLAPLVLEKLPLLGASIVFGLLTAHLQKGLGATAPWEQWGLWARTSTALSGYFHYLAAALFPANLAAYYPLQAKTAPLEWIAGAVLLCAGCALAWRLRKQAPYVAVGWLWFVLTMLPVSGVMQSGTQAWADRFFYIPGMGLYIALVWGAVDALGRRKALLGALLAGVALALCVGSFMQVRHWRNAVTLNERITQVSPDCAPCLITLGELYMQGGQLDKSEQTFHQALVQKPNAAAALAGLGHLYFRVKRYEEAASALEDSLAAAPDSPNSITHNVLGACYSALRRYEQAVQQFQAALRANPDNEEARKNLKKVKALSKE